MGNSERKNHYLKIYRMQLRRETDVMGYGQQQGYLPMPNYEPQISKRLTTSWAIFAVVLMVVGFIGAQI